MVSCRPEAGLFYADYDLVEATDQGEESTSERRLLDWHEGRLRDAFDLGRVWFVDADRLKKAGGPNPDYQAADLYDLRLRLGEQGPLVHIANRYAGSLYAVYAGGSKHNVFDYLLSDKASQLEMEKALGEHLQRTGAYLAPGAHYQEIANDPEEKTAPGGCLASIVIPVNNRPGFIGRAVESVLAQTVREVEVLVVVNGGPDDPTIPAVREYLEGGGPSTIPPPRRSG